MSARVDAALRPSPEPARRVRLAVDAMGGEGGVAVAAPAAAAAVAADPGLDVILVGDGDAIASAASAVAVGRSRISVEDASAVVPMGASATEALRTGRGSSMWRALDLVGAGHADAAVSSGDTAALMALSNVRLRVADPIKRPAIAALWPSTGAAGGAVVLDVGANLTADASALVDFAIMGVEYARIALGVETPRVALLNVGTEPTKGRPEIKEAAIRIAAALETGALDARFVGFVEGDDIAVDRADVVVTDGFCGNVALKTAEGTARLIASFLRSAFEADLFSKAAGLAATPALRRLRARMDPRRVNGGVFLGLSGAVVKSHGGADVVGFESAIALAARIARADAAQRIADGAARIRAAAERAAGDGSTGS